MRINVSIAGMAVLALSAAQIASAAPVVILGPLTNPGNGVTYELIGDSVSGGPAQASDWKTIQADAQTLGGNLVTIHDAAENQWLADNFVAAYQSAKFPFWIGLYDPTANDGSGALHAANFVWVDGSASAYRNWAPHEPNNQDNVEYYGVINYDYFQLSYPNSYSNKWNDVALTGSVDGPVPSSGPYLGLVQLSVPEPASLGLLGIGGAAVLSRRKR